MNAAILLCILFIKVPNTPCGTQLTTAIPANKSEATLSCNEKAELSGSDESSKRQNAQADKENLTRIENREQLEKFKRAMLLVPIPKNNEIQIDSRIPNELRWCRPWTKTFLLNMSHNHWGTFEKSIQINSAVRTVEYQKRLRRRNANAAPIEGEKTSSHLTGSTVDIAKLGMSKKQLEWMRTYLLRLEKCGLIEATEEFNQAVFHVMVFKHYSAPENDEQNPPD